jgi:hypothetical protein
MTDSPKRPPRRIGSKKAGPAAEPAAEPADETDPPVGRRALITVERLFFFCILGGFAAASAGIAMGGEFGRTITLLSPLAATLAYPVLGILLGFSGRPSVKERFADNCYYLGFIFTQGGLLLAFLPTTIRNQTITSGEVMQFFGMAIGAALIGLIARTVLTQTGMSLTDVSDSVHHEVEMLAAKVTQQSERVVAEFDRISEHVGNVPERFAERLDRQIDGIDSVFARLKSTLDQTVAELDQGRAVVREAAAGTRESHAEGIRTLVAAMQEAAGAIHALKAEMIDRTAEGAEAIRAATAGLTAGMESLAGLGQLGRRMPEIEAEVRRLAEASAGARGATEQLSRELGTAVLTAQESLAEVAREGSATIRESSQAAAKQLADAGNQAGAELEQRAGGWQIGLEQAKAALEAAAIAGRDGLAGAAEEGAASIRDSSQAAARAIADAGGRSAVTLGDRAKGFESELDQAAATFESILRQFSERLNALSDAPRTNG